MQLVHPAVVTIDDEGTRVYHSIQNVPFSLLPHIARALGERYHTLQRQADMWEAGGFINNAVWWRWEARMSQLDAYRMQVELGLVEEDEDLEQEINMYVETQTIGRVAEWEGSTIAR